MRSAYLPQALFSSALLFALAGCGDTAAKRPINATCAETVDCQAGECISGYCLDPESDEDGDQLLNRVEGALGSNARSVDTDYDGVNDGVEVDGIAPRDTDGDGIPDILESAVNDPDHDCLPDEVDPDNVTPSVDLLILRDKVCGRHGICAAQTELITASCPDDTRIPQCDFSQVLGYEAVEHTCDGADNDCDGAVDENTADANGDGVPDCSDPDADSDGIANAADNCPLRANDTQTDVDGDDVGDACDVPATPLVTSTVPSSPGLGTTPHAIGTGEPLSTLRFYRDAACAVSAGEGAVDAAGTFDVVVTVVANAETRLYAIAVNPAGLESACASTFGSYLEDSTAPGAPALTSPPASPTNLQTLLLTGTAEAQATVTLYRTAACATAVATADAALGGSFTASFALTPGAANDVYGTATDLAGNRSACVFLGAFSQDDAAPSAPTLDGATQELLTAPVAAPGTVVLSGCAESGATVSVWSAAGCDVATLGNGLASTASEGCGAGRSAFTLTATLPPNAVTALYLRATDAAGNGSACVLGGTATEDETAPDAPVILSAAAVLWDDAGYTFVVRGLAEGGGTVLLGTDPTCAFTAPSEANVDANGTFSGEVVLAPQDGAAQVYATVQDAAGNVSGCSAGLLVLGEIEVFVLDPATGEGDVGIAVQLHAPNGDPLEVGTTDDSGSVRFAMFGGCGVTAAIVDNDGYYQWKSALALNPGVTVRFDGAVTATESMTYYPRVMASNVPAGTTRITWRTPCGTFTEYGPGQQPYQLNLYGYCVPDGEFDLIAEARDDNSTLLGWGALEDVKLPTILTDAGPNLGGAIVDAEVTEWSPDPGALDLTLVTSCSAVSATVRLILALGGFDFGNAYPDDYKYVVAVPERPAYVPFRFGLLPGLASGFEIAVRTTSLENYGDGEATYAVRGMSSPATAEVTAPDQFLPSVYRADFDVYADGGPEFRWFSAAGMSIAADVQRAYAYFSYDGGGVDWEVVTRPSEEGRFALPRFSSEFPGAWTLAGYGYASGSVEWLDLDGVDGYDEAVGVHGGNVDVPFQASSEAGVLRRTECCGGGE